MGDADSVDTCRDLAEMFRAQQVLRPMRIGRYDAGDELAFEVTGVVPARRTRVRLKIERFVGGGFAGQVYRVVVLEADGEAIEGLAVGAAYAMKILIPPSGFARRFRDAIYRLGFQGPFSLQCDPAAARAGALWQKFIRRAAAIRLGDEQAVVDVLATFVDSRLGSCGELSEWVDGRNWLFEVDDHLNARRAWARGKEVPAEGLGAPEYRSKKAFMAAIVGLLHEVGAPELARQYEWSTCKSQPNVLKRTGADDEPAAGLTAVDFRAGLALLPFLPMSPGDFSLIGKGLARGSLVQFDRGDLGKLEAFVNAHGERFADMREALTELKATDGQYRRSLPDVTHHHVRLLYDGRLWAGVLDGAVTSWRTRNIADEAAAARLGRSRLLTLMFVLLGALPALGLAAAVSLLAAGWVRGFLSPSLWLLAAGLGVILPAAAKLVRALAGCADLRRHYGRMLASPDYLRRALLAHLAETLIRWLRSGRIGPDRAERLAGQPWRAIPHVPLSLLPAGLHRILTDARFALAKLAYIFVRPVRLYFNADAREQWLREMVAEGRRKHMLSDSDVGLILGRIKEPFIQKYLKSLAVHVCTLPVTQVVSFTTAAVWWLTHRDRPTAWAEGLAIIAAFQITPISPGSLVRGFYVVYLVLRERNVKDYNIAVFLGFFKYIGYLAFPIQMAYRYPALARFMAGHWATEAVHIVPVFGEHGALLEHAVFDLFYNRPLTVRRMMRVRADRRGRLKARTWHAGPILAAAVGIMALADLAWTKITFGQWAAGAHADALGWLVALAPAAAVGVLIGAAATLGAGGATLGRRLVTSVVCGAAAGVASALVAGAFVRATGSHPNTFAMMPTAWPLAMWAAWRGFVFALLACVAALVVEVNLPEPGDSTQKP